MDHNGYNGDDDFNSNSYAISGKIMLAAIAILFTVVLFIMGLHIYARCFWQRSLGAARRRGGSSRRRRLAFAADHDPQRLHRVGLEKSVIESLPVFVYRVENYKDDGLECAVCLCEFEENEKGRLLPRCNHTFHIDCIDMWLDSHSTCPLCRCSARPDPEDETPSPVDHVVVVVEGSSSTTAGEEQLPVSVTVDGNPGSESGREELCDSCRHDDGGLPSPTYPTNVLFWGNQKRVSLRPNGGALVEQGTTSSSSGKFVIDIPARRGDSFSSPREDFSPGGPSSHKSPSTRLRSLKRLLSRGGLPQSPGGSAHITEQGGQDQS